MLFLKSTLHPKKLVTVKLTSWCVNHISKLGAGAHVDILHLPDDSNTWEIFTSLPLTHEAQFQFETLDFSPYAVAAQPDLLDCGEFILWGFLYADNDDNFTILIQLNSELLASHIERVLLPSRKVKFLGVMQVREDDQIRVEISAENLEFEHGGSFLVTANELWIGQQQWKVFHTFITNNHQAPADGRIMLNYRVRHNNLDCVDERLQYKLKKGDPAAVDTQNIIYARHVDIVQDGDIENQIHGDARIVGLHNDNEGGYDLPSLDDENVQRPPEIVQAHAAIDPPAAHVQPPQEDDQGQNGHLHDLNQPLQQQFDHPMAGPRQPRHNLELEQPLHNEHPGHDVNNAGNVRRDGNYRNRFFPPY